MEKFWNNNRIIWTSNFIKIKVCFFKYRLNEINHFARFGTAREKATPHIQVPSPWNDTENNDVARALLMHDELVQVLSDTLNVCNIYASATIIEISRIPLNCCCASISMIEGEGPNISSCNGRSDSSVSCSFEQEFRIKLPISNTKLPWSYTHILQPRWCSSPAELTRHVS